MKKQTKQRRVFHFSGGHTSAMMTLIMKPTENDVVLFADTGREHPGTYKFIEDFERHEGIKVHTCTYSHESVPGLYGMDALIERKKYLPNKLKRICTAELKVNTARRYLVSIGIKSYTSHIGFRYDEQRRIVGHVSRWKSVTEVFPLNELRINKAQVEDYWSKKPYKLEIPRILGNCDCCFMKGKNALMVIFQHFPELAQRWIDDEEKMSASLGHKKPPRYIQHTSYKDLLDASQRQTRLFEIEAAESAFNCACTT